MLSKTQKTLIRINTLLQILKYLTNSEYQNITQCVSCRHLLLLELLLHKYLPLLHLHLIRLCLFLRKELKGILRYFLNLRIISFRIISNTACQQLKELKIQKTFWTPPLHYLTQTYLMNKKSTCIQFLRKPTLQINPKPFSVNIKMISMPRQFIPKP